KMVPDEPDITIRVTGNMWWWDVYYPDSEVRIANEIYIPVGANVKVELVANDVIHSFWVPNLGGKTDAIPGITNNHWMRADKAGNFLGECAEFCGVQHARM